MMRKDQKGFTLVELLIAVAILSVVTATVAGFIVVGSKTYASANNDITIQQEAQLALNQMSDVMIDTTRSINYAGHRTGSAESQQVLKDSEFTFEPDAKSLTLYNGEAVAVASAGGSGSTDTEIQEGNGNQNYQFYWVKDDETLYYHEIGVKETFPDIDLSDSSAGWEVLAEHVTDFSVDLTQVEEKRVVALELTFEIGNKEYTTSNNVTVRNRILTNDVEIAALDKTVTLSVIPKKSSVILEPGETYHFSTPKVTGKNILDKSVTWTVEGGATAAGSDFTDATNGVIQISSTESVVSFNAIVTTNAQDSNGNHATATVIVYVKRAHNVSMTKTSDSVSDNGNDQVSANCVFTISAEATGVKLGVSCDGCDADVSRDKTVEASASVVGWAVLDGADLVTINSSDQSSATFKVSGSAKDGDVIKIRATSWLSVQKGYGNEDSDNGLVTGVIILTVTQGQSTRPLGSLLQYGDETIPSYLVHGLSTDHSKLVECIWVVDNSGKEQDRFLMHYTTGNGFDIRIAPDLFDLDLNGNYTFYIQILDPVSVEHRVQYGQTNVVEDSDSEIWNEYINNYANYEYTGDKYYVSPLYSQVLEKPTFTYTYHEVEYTATPFTMDTIYVNSVGTGSGYTDGPLEPTGYGNIWGNSGYNSLQYIIYKGEGSDPSKWTKLYWYDLESGSYKGYEGHDDGSFYDGMLKINAPRGNPFFQRQTASLNTEVYGTYHIVPVMVYQNKDPGRYTIIGSLGFEFDKLARELKAYELTESTITVKLTGDAVPQTTMHIEQSGFYTGDVVFPLPSDAEYNSDFPDSNSATWQSREKSLRVMNANGKKDVKFSRVRYMYVSGEDTYYVEPFYRISLNDLFTVEYSCGIYKCAGNGSKWERVGNGTAATTISKATMHINTEKYKGDVVFPLPSQSDFKSTFTSYTTATWQTTYQSLTVKGHADGASNNTIDSVTFPKVKYRYNSAENAYYVEPFFTETINDLYVKQYSCGIYKCDANGENWERVGDGDGTQTVYSATMLGVDTEFFKGDLVFPLPSATNYKSYFPAYRSSSWKETTGSMTVTGLRSGSSSSESVTIASVKYRYDSKNKEYYVEPIFKKQVTYLSDVVYSCGVYKASVDDGTWTKVEEGSSSTSTKATITLTVDGVEYEVDIPLPSESDFWFTGGKTSNGYTGLTGYNANAYYGTWIGFDDVTCSYDATSKTYTIEFLKNTWSNPKYKSYGVYTCTAKGDHWELQTIPSPHN